MEPINISHKPLEPTKGFMNREMTVVVPRLDWKIQWYFKRVIDCILYEYSRSSCRLC